MTYNPDYTIELAEGKKVPLLFNSWTFKTFSEKLGLTYEGLLNAVSESLIGSNNLALILLTAAQSWHLFNKVDFKETELEAFVWIDELGGFSSPKLLPVYQVFFAKLLGVSVDQLEVTTKEQPSDEKNALSL